ncbi:hypothetical protein XELAEV_18004176mg [Xenopus laevis]|uniref:Uncharacterized protein n=1 Tax=Xenopus laevis TaxID=8355 RepID=A0A974BNH4_XENLA|nr:hypothetical protein XELAEV_18004176mg [Xenopus laevis]
MKQGKEQDWENTHWRKNGLRKITLRKVHVIHILPSQIDLEHLTQLEKKSYIYLATFVSKKNRYGICYPET